MSVHPLTGTVDQPYEGEEFSSEELESIAEELTAALRAAIQSRGRELPEFSQAPGVIFTGP